MMKKFNLIVFLLVLSGLFVACAANYNSNENPGSSAQQTVVEEGVDSALNAEGNVEEESNDETDNASGDYTFIDLNDSMYTKDSVNVRSLPCKDGEKIGEYAAAQEVVVTGQCVETNWYRVDYNGTVAYVSNNFLVAENPATEVAKAEQPKPTSAPVPEPTPTPASEPTPNQEPTPIPESVPLPESIAPDNGIANNSGNISSENDTNTTPADSPKQSASHKSSEPGVTVPGHEDTEGNLVWVPTKGGKKYHSSASCSQMKDPMQVTIEHATQNGYTPCKRCYP